MVKVMPHINHSNQLYKASLMDKHIRRSFLKEAMSIATMPLQLFHTNICRQSIYNHLVTINFIFY
jgi:hypothetical protein